MRPIVLCAATLVAASAAPAAASAQVSPSAAEGETAPVPRAAAHDSDDGDGPLPPDTIVYPFARPPAPDRSAAPAPSLHASLGLGLAGTAAAAGMIYVGHQRGSTALAVLGAAGLVFGPSTGQYYAGDERAGTRGASIRATGVGILAAGAVGIATGMLSDVDCAHVESGGIGFDCVPSAFTAGGAILLTGSGIAVAGTLYSVVDAPFAAARDRERGQLAVIPSPVRAASGESRPGLGVAASF